MPMGHGRRRPASDGEGTPRLATDALRPPPRSARPLAARCRSGRHRPRARPGRALERPDGGAASSSRSRSTACSWRRSQAIWTLDPAPWRLAMLLHDAPEYVIGDIISPFKAVIGDAYKAVEARPARGHPPAFRLAGGTQRAARKLIKRADRQAAFLEATRLAGFSSRGGDEILRPPRTPAPSGVRPGGAVADCHGAGAFPRSGRNPADRLSFHSNATDVVFVFTVTG